MLYFPLEYNLRHNISEQVAQADLEFYVAHTEPCKIVILSPICLLSVSLIQEVSLFQRPT